MLQAWYFWASIRNTAVRLSQAEDFDKLAGTFGICAVELEKHWIAHAVVV